MPKKRGDDTRLWQVGSFTPLPNDVLDWMIHEAETFAEVRIVLLIARLSCGFNLIRTNGRLCRRDFAEELGLNTKTVSRAIAKLLKTGRIHRSDPQGAFCYYSIYPSAKALENVFQAGTSKSPFGDVNVPMMGRKCPHDGTQMSPTGDVNVPDRGRKCPTAVQELSRVNALRAGHGTEHISSILQRIRPC